MNELIEKRTPEQIGAEIRMYMDVGRRVTLLCAIEIGRRLVEAKEMLSHGEWMPWLERETEFSSSSAQRYMTVFREYGASQLGLFGPETNSPTLGNLPISKALALLSVPESDRTEFAETVDAEHISVRELEEKIRERDEALAREKKETEKMQAAIDTLCEDRDDLDRLREEAEKKLEEAQTQIRELESRPIEVAVERDEAAIAEAATLAREKAEAEAKKKIDALEKKLSKAEDEAAAAKKEAQTAGEGAAEKEAAAKKEADALRAQLEEARKQLKASASDVTAFGIRYNSIQNEFEYMFAELQKVEERDSETGEKLRAAVRELIEYYKKKVEGEG